MMMMMILRCSQSKTVVQYPRRNMMLSLSHSFIDRCSYHHEQHPKIEKNHSHHHHLLPLLPSSSSSPRFDRTMSTLLQSRSSTNSIRSSLVFSFGSTTTKYRTMSTYNNNVQKEIEDAHERQDKVKIQTIFITKDEHIKDITDEITTDVFHGVYACQSFQVGDLVIQARALETFSEPTTHSIQLGWKTHVDMDLPSRFLNHICGKRRKRNEVVVLEDDGAGLDDNDTVDEDGANVKVQGPNQYGAYDFIAICPISKGEQITFDYECTEYELTNNGFECHCGSSKCRGHIRGFKYNQDQIIAEHGLENISSYLKKGKNENATAGNEHKIKK